MNFQTLVRLARLGRYQFGRKLRLGVNDYAVRGFVANPLAVDAMHEPYMQPVIERALARHAGAFVDIGANTGQTLMKVLASDPTRTYVGFEPQVGCCSMLDRFLRDNALRHACVMPIALADRNGLSAFFADYDGDEMASLASAEDRYGAKRRHTAWVSTRLGDEVLSEIGVTEVGVIKIDVEGAEASVMAGLANTLRTRQPAVIFEVLPNFFGARREYLPDRACIHNRDMAARIWTMLVGSGYHVFQIDADGGEHRIEGFDLDNVQGFVGSNYVAYHL